MSLPFRLSILSKRALASSGVVSPPGVRMGVVARGVCGAELAGLAGTLLEELLLEALFCDSCVWNLAASWLVVDSLKFPKVCLV